MTRLSDREVAALDALIDLGATTPEGALSPFQSLTLQTHAAPMTLALLADKGLAAFEVRELAGGGSRVFWRATEAGVDARSVRRRA